VTTDWSAVARDPAAFGWEPMDEGGFPDHVGPFWRKQEDGQDLYGIVAEGKHGNHHKFVHGGLVMTLVDYAVGMASVAAVGHFNQVTLQLDVQFLDPARIDEFLIGRGELLRRTSSLAFLRGTVEASGRIVAAANGIWKIIKPRPSE
jgi:uncharacterized protein (TIGR00369 family)